VRDVIASGRNPWRDNPRWGKVTLARRQPEWQSAKGVSGLLFGFRLFPADPDHVLPLSVLRRRD
jgi:hypothetical protein